jgi:hypothetical protein
VRRFRFAYQQPQEDPPPVSFRRFNPLVFRPNRRQVEESTLPALDCAVGGDESTTTPKAGGLNFLAAPLAAGKKRQQQFWASLLNLQ